MVENDIATISDLEPPSLNASGDVILSFSIADDEGDDQAILVEVCEGSERAPTRCGVAVEGRGSDGVAFLPTQPNGSSLQHRFVWSAACGRYDDQGHRPSELQTEYVSRLRVQDAPLSSSPWHYTEAFSLSELGLEALPRCER